MLRRFLRLHDSRFDVCSAYPKDVVFGMSGGQLRAYQADCFCRSSAPEIDNQIMGHVMGPIEAPGGTTLSAEAVRINPEEWYPHYQSCMKHFLDVAQYTQTIQALAAFLNIRLPCQRAVDPVLHYVDWPGHRESDYVTALQSLRSSAVSLIPYIRRLVVTGSDTPAVLSAMFGESWVKGVGPLHSQERINYLFAAKSGGWLSTKSQYDQSAEETVPFLRPLCNAQEYEIREAETRWSEWLAMEDWMLGARSPWAGEEA